VEEHARLCKPETIHIMDGSERENDLLLYVLQRDGMIRRCAKLDNW
jgi:GTP-dependent phosphoenolpyruvate carboxykinase